MLKNRYLSSMHDFILFSTCFLHTLYRTCFLEAQVDNRGRQDFTLRRSSPWVEEEMTIQILSKISSPPQITKGQT